MSWGRRRRRFMIWESLAVLTANNGTCAYCYEASQTMDHVIPFADGGADELKNLVPVCRECNWSKGGKTPPAWHIGIDLRIRWSGDGTPQGGGSVDNSSLRDLYLSAHGEVLEMLDRLDEVAAEIADPKRLEWFRSRYGYLGYPSATNGAPRARAICEGRIAEAKKQGYPDPVMGHEEAVALARTTRQLLDAYFGSA
ncbi:HNH endonuclease signature motif containing protein [Streptomyces sp. NPDC048428]|uniref:HNH endonuclease n=1 Tax=Streptomyces sp. NPDC048428 TaxID=3154503 RepID=UPI003414189A